MKGFEQHHSNIFPCIGLTEDYTKNWSWDDGGVGVTPFNDWAVGQPYEEAGVPGCGVVDIHVKWSVSHCETERRSVCQKADNGLGEFFQSSTTSARLSKNPEQHKKENK